MPVVNQFAFWEDFEIKRKTPRFTMALAAWCRVRGLDEQGSRTLAKARLMVTRENFSSMGKPTRVIRVHLADEIQEHWVFGTMGIVIDGPAENLFEGRQLVQEFFAEPTNTYLVLRTGIKGESKGYVYDL